MHTCVSQRPKRPQLSDTINRLDEMIETLSTAIPGAVSESVREVLGASLVAAIGDAVREAVKVGVREGVQAAMGEAVASAAAPAAPVSDPNAGAPPGPGTAHKGPGVWARIRALAGGLRRWVTRRVAPVVARLTIGWAIVKLVWRLDDPFPVGGTLDRTGRCRGWLHGVRGRPDRIGRSPGPGGRGDHRDSGLGSPNRLPAHGVARRIGRWPKAG